MFHSLHIKQGKYLKESKKLARERERENVLLRAYKMFFQDFSLRKMEVLCLFMLEPENFFLSKIFTIIGPADKQRGCVLFGANIYLSSH